MFRDKSRGLEGGYFHSATLLNRKEVKSKKGKNAIDEFKEFFLLKADATFIHNFIKQHNLQSNKDNTPHLMRKANASKKKQYLHDLVADTLRDLLPYFKECSVSDDMLPDFPLAAGRKVAQTSEDSIEDEVGVSSSYPKFEPEADSIDESNVKRSVAQQTEALLISGPGNSYKCSICKFESKLKSICIAHIDSCSSSVSQCAASSSLAGSVHSSDAHIKDDSYEEESVNIEDDMYWNYKCSEFFMDSLCALSSVYEKFGDGLGMLIISKVLLPIFHGLRHSNYSTSIHRFITRLLCELTPREALKLRQERFSNKKGRNGGNIFKDRRMEHRIGRLKPLIGNLGPNFGEDSIQQVNKVIDIKEQLYIQTRISHGVNVRSGNHNPRSDAQDFHLLLDMLEKTEAHKKIEGRKFGEFSLSANLLECEVFDEASFYRWITEKNKEAQRILKAKQGSTNCK